MRLLSKIDPNNDEDRKFGLLCCPSITKVKKRYAKFEDEFSSKEGRFEELKFSYLISRIVLKLSKGWMLFLLSIWATQPPCHIALMYQTRGESLLLDIKQEEHHNIWKVFTSFFYPLNFLEIVVSNLLLCPSHPGKSNSSTTCVDTAPPSFQTSSTCLI